MNTFLRVKNANIINQKGIKTILRGVNFGSWLMMEGYILGGRNIPAYRFKNTFRRVNKNSGLDEFMRLFRKNFIQPIDFKNVKDLGFNCIRLPFNYRLVWKKHGLNYLDKAVKLCRKNKIYCILDLHAAPGSQNIDWHSDSNGKALLWNNKGHQKKLIHTWEFLADRFKDEPTIAGYDLLNEGVCKNERIFLKLYKQLVREIRGIDRKHIIFLEGNKYAQDLGFMGRPWDDNLVYSVHFYLPLEFIFGFVRNLKYPGYIYNNYFSRWNLEKALLRYYRIKKRYSIPIFVGEFGINSRCPYCHKELAWLKDTLDLFKKFGFHWTYWTYKAVASGIYPDGIYQYTDNPAWVNRQDEIFGWETYYNLWKKNKENIVNSWRTEQFTANQALIAILKKK